MFVCNWNTSQSEDGKKKKKKKQSFPLPGMLEHILMMGGQLCEGSAWRCLPLREQGIARFAARCRRMDDIYDSTLIPELMDIIEGVVIDDVPSDLLKNIVKSSLPVEPLPSQIAASLNLAVLKWFDQRYLLSFHAQHYVVTDLNKGKTYRMWRLSSEM